MADTRRLWYKKYREPSAITAPKLRGTVICVNFVTLAKHQMTDVAPVENLAFEGDERCCRRLTTHQIASAFSRRSRMKQRFYVGRFFFSWIVLLRHATNRAQ